MSQRPELDPKKILAQFKAAPPPEEFDRMFFDELRNRESGSEKKLSSATWPASIAWLFTAAALLLVFWRILPAQRGENEFGASKPNIILDKDSEIKTLAAILHKSFDLPEADGMEGEVLRRYRKIVFAEWKDHGYMAAFETGDLKSKADAILVSGLIDRVDQKYHHAGEFYYEDLLKFWTASSEQSAKSFQTFFASGMGSTKHRILGLPPLKNKNDCEALAERLNMPAVFVEEKDWLRLVEDDAPLEKNGKRIIQEDFETEFDLEARKNAKAFPKQESGSGLENGFRLFHFNLKSEKTCNKPDIKVRLRVILDEAKKTVLLSIDKVGEPENPDDGFLMQFKAEQEFSLPLRQGTYDCVIQGGATEKSCRIHIHEDRLEIKDGEDLLLSSHSLPDHLVGRPDGIDTAKKMEDWFSDLISGDETKNRDAMKKFMHNAKEGKPFIQNRMENCWYLCGGGFLGGLEANGIRKEQIEIEIIDKPEDFGEYDASVLPVDLNTHKIFDVTVNSKSDWSLGFGEPVVSETKILFPIIDFGEGQGILGSHNLRLALPRAWIKDRKVEFNMKKGKTADLRLSSPGFFDMLELFARLQVVGELYETLSFEKRLGLCLLCDTTTCRINDRISLQVWILNDGKDDVWLPGSLDASDQRIRSPFVEIQVKDPDGKTEILKLVRLDEAPEQIFAGDFVRLPAGRMFNPYGLRACSANYPDNPEYLFFESNPVRLWRPEKAGTYEITCVYDSSDFTKGANGFGKHKLKLEWTEEVARLAEKVPQVKLISNVVKIRVEK